MEDICHHANYVRLINAPVLDLFFDVREIKFRTNGREISTMRSRQYYGVKELRNDDDELIIMIFLLLVDLFSLWLHIEQSKDR